jgi:hopanoid C-3 methylase HpnR
MKILATHPSGLNYIKIYLRLEPLGLELVAQAMREAGHEVRVIDLQVETHKDYFQIIKSWQPDAIAFSCNYITNIPEIINLAKATKKLLPDSFIFIGGHSSSFIAEEILEHGQGAIDCVLKGEGESGARELVKAIEQDRKALDQVPGAVSERGYGPPSIFVDSLNDLLPARDLLHHRRKYFIGLLDPAESMEFSRGCPWDCNFCSAWTFYGRSYRLKDPELIVDELARIKSPGIFIIDDVSFVQESHGMAIAELIAKRGLKKKFYLETRCDVLLRNKEVFKAWRKIGLQYMFLGLEAIDSEGLQKFRKRISLSKNLEALEYARSLGITVAVNLISDPSWDHERFKTVREWAMEIPDIVNISVLTPYPGTETWYTDGQHLASRDYRLFDLLHSVMPTRLPLDEFYDEMMSIQLNVQNKMVDPKDSIPALLEAARNLLRGQTNFLGLFLKYHKIYDPKRLLADHERPVEYEIGMPPIMLEKVDIKGLYIHPPNGRKSRSLDETSEQFVDATRMGTAG